MKPKILLVNPPVYDFTAYDFWLKPYGMLQAAGFLRDKAEFVLFDYMDRLHPFMAARENLKSDKWGKGRFFEQHVPNPEVLKAIPRYFRRYGLPRELFRELLKDNSDIDFVFIQTVMTYWYLGIAEVIEDIRAFCPKAKIVLGGNYATLCPEHAGKLGADLLIYGKELNPLWDFLKIVPDLNQPPLWELYPKLNVAALKITDGCPFSCTYCSVSQVYGKFQPRSFEKTIGELEFLVKLGATNVAFYDDALLFHFESVLKRFLNKVVEMQINVNFHTPNALNARFLTPEAAQLMVDAGFKTFYLGFESVSSKWHSKTGSKLLSEELATAVENLKAAGADRREITAYQIVGHPNGDIQESEETMHFVNSLGILGMLADFSPIPGTADGEACSKWVDLSEPLMHNKIAFPILKSGFDEINRLKDLQRKLNRTEQ